MDAVRELSWNAATLKLSWDDGLRREYTAAWLLDNMPGSRQGSAGQKLTDVRDLPGNAGIHSAALDDDGGIEVRFEGETRARFSSAWLRHPSGSVSLPTPEPWDASLSATLPAAHWSDIAVDDAALAEWLACVVRRGFAIVRGVPAIPDTVFEVVSRFGYVRETNYGRLFDVVSREQPANLAYSPLALSLHTDNPYRDPVPTLQLLHCLIAGREGGETVLADGVRVAEGFRRENPEDFAILARTPVRFRYVDEFADLQCVAPMIECGVDDGVRALRYNQRSLAPLELPPGKTDSFYQAYRRFSEALHDSGGLVAFTMTPGDLVIMDNRRVLHGRRGNVVGHRHLQGCYADIDGLESRLRRLLAPTE